MKGVWREIRESLDIGRFAGSFRDRWVWLAFLLGGIGLLFPSGGLPPLWRLAFAACSSVSLSNACRANGGCLRAACC